MNLGEESRREVEKDRRTILIEKKEKKRSMKGTKTKRDDSKGWTGKNRYIGGNYSRSITR